MQTIFGVLIHEVTLTRTHYLNFNVFSIDIVALIFCFEIIDHLFTAIATNTDFQCSCQGCWIFQKKKNKTVNNFETDYKFEITKQLETF